MSVLSAKHFHDESEAYRVIEARLWPNGPVCPHCGIIDNAAQLKGKSTRIGVYKCRDCRKPFTVKVGTIFEASHIPMHVWLQGIALLSSSKKGISANQLHRTLGITLKSAWFMAHRIREAMAPASPEKLGGEGKIVESDETEISFSNKTKETPARARTADRKRFVSLVERGGGVRSRKITGAAKAMGAEIREALIQNINRDSMLHTDGAPRYIPVPFAHESVDHNKTYLRTTPEGAKVHTNSAEGYFSIFKRGPVGTYQHMSSQHLHRYLAEFDFRMSNRARLGVDDMERADRALKGAIGKRLTYRTPCRH